MTQKSHIFSSQSKMKLNAKNSGSAYLYYPLPNQIIIIFCFAALGIKLFFFIPPFSKIVHPVKKKANKQTCVWNVTQEDRIVYFCDVILWFLHRKYNSVVIFALLFINNDSVGQELPFLQTPHFLNFDNIITNVDVIATQLMTIFKEVTKNFVLDNTFYY